MATYEIAIDTYKGKDEFPTTTTARTIKAGSVYEVRKKLFDKIYGKKNVKMWVFLGDRHLGVISYDKGLVCWSFADSPMPKNS